ncbi:MAG: nuclear transport factor 2 family protein [Bacteroidetes bacterium]|nr:nuclear transport factor 2 family protein [Bacteroidota bacterium]
MRKKSLLSIALGVMVMLAGVQNLYGQSSNVIDEHYKAINNHDIKTIASEYAGDAQAFSPNWEGAKVGPDGATDTFTRYFRSTPDLSYTVNNRISTGNSVVVEYTFTGTLSAPEAGTPDYMKGKKYTLQGCAVFILKDNKIAKETNYFDQVAFLRQVGFFDQNH